MSSAKVGYRAPGVDGAHSCAAPRQAVILAAGRASQLSPYTDSAPTALISINERPMIAHSLEALRRQGVEHFVICRGWQGEAFEERIEELGKGVVLVDCPEYDSTGMLATLRLALPHLLAGPFYMVYGDIIFRPNVVRQLRDAAGTISVVVNTAAPGNQTKGDQDVEVVETAGEGAARVVRRIGKGRCPCIRSEGLASEFAGLVKFSTEGRTIAEEALTRIFAESCRLPWWLEPVLRASICDLLQLLADEAMSIVPVMIYGGWHEVNTPQDLTRVWNDTAMFLSEADTKSQVAAMGACLLSEANDLKRPLPIVARELNVPLPKLECLLRGDLEVGDALDVLRTMNEVYPVPLNDLWLDADDTLEGVRHFTADASKASARILDRPDRTGKRTPYYEYRDAAMSRCSQFRPEWIKELRFVNSPDPNDADVAMNNGHLMMQTTMFIGPVNFYWKDRTGKTHCRECNSGDSNFISPFVPHSFTVREEGQEGVIIAVTYGGRVRRAFTEFTRIGAKRVLSLAGDKREPELTRRCVLKRALDSECMSAKDLAVAATGDISESRVLQLLEGQEGTLEELSILARVLNVQLGDLLVTPLEEEEEVVVTRTEDSHKQARHTDTYILAPLARTRHQPDLKTFDMEVRDTAQPGDALSCGLHSFIYHFGTEPVQLTWQGRDAKSKGQSRPHSVKVAPGDSVYIAPLVEHRFSVVQADAEAGCGSCDTKGLAQVKGRRLFVVRIPGHLTAETLSEFATFSAFGRERVGAETTQWYN